MKLRDSPSWVTEKQGVGVSVMQQQHPPPFKTRIQRRASDEQDGL
jgi:hypothetical protein